MAVCIKRCRDRGNSSFSKKMWNNDHIISLVAQNCQVIMPIIIPALELKNQNHWNQAVLNLTANVMKVFSEMDEELFSTCLTKVQGGRGKSSVDGGEAEAEVGETRVCYNSPASDRPHSRPGRVGRQSSVIV